MSNLKFALDYASRGWPVFPVWQIKDGKCSCGEADCEHSGKHPLGKLAPKGRNSATTNPETIKRWWGKYPDANIAIVTGPESGLVVVDVDPRHGGNETKKKLERSGNFPYPPLPTPAAAVSISSWLTLAIRKSKAKTTGNPA